MELCSRQCLRRTFYAVLVGISPIILSLLLIAIARFVLHCFEFVYIRRQKSLIRRHSSTVFLQSGRPTLSYTPISIEEIQRIIQGHYHSRQQGEVDSPKGSHFMKSIFTRRESSPLTSSNTLTNLVIRRNAMDSDPLTAIIAPVTTPTYERVNEQTIRRPSGKMMKCESTMNHSRDSIFYNANDTCECESTTTTTDVVEEFLDFQSVHSVPYSFYSSNSLEDDENETLVDKYTSPI